MKVARQISELRRAFSDAWPPTVRFIEWASATETPDETSTADLAKKLRLSKSDAKELVGGIVELELARFVVGRRGQPSRLIWMVTLHSIAAVAKAHADAFVPVGRNTLTNRSTAHDNINHTFQLRRELRVSFELPDDLTKDEADRLAAFIQTLPFEE